MAHRMYVVGDKLVVEFEGLEEIAAIKRRLEFSLSNIVSVSTEPHRWIEGERHGHSGSNKRGTICNRWEECFLLNEAPGQVRDRGFQE